MWVKCEVGGGGGRWWVSVGKVLGGREVRWCVSVGKV